MTEESGRSGAEAPTALSSANADQAASRLAADALQSTGAAHAVKTHRQLFTPTLAELPSIIDQAVEVLGSTRTVSPTCRIDKGLLLDLVNTARARLESESADLADAAAKLLHLYGPPDCHTPETGDAWLRLSAALDRAIGAA